MFQKQEKDDNQKGMIILINDICNQAIIDINKIKRNRNNQIKSILAEVDRRQADKILKSIKN